MRKPTLVFHLFDLVKHSRVFQSFENFFEFLLFLSNNVTGSQILASKYGHLIVSGDRLYAVLFRFLVIA